MPACCEPACVALAGPSGYCAPHAAGFRLHGTDDELRCGNCRRLVRKDHWYRQDATGAIVHAVPCVMHPDVAKALEDAAPPA